MKRFIILFITVILALSSIGCDKVEPGYVGIKVNMYGSQRGVEDFPLITGRVWYNPFTEDLYKFPTFLQNVVWTQANTEGSPNDESITFNSVEGAVINADIALSYGFIADKVPSLFIEFRRSADQITDVYMRSQVRDAFSRIASKRHVVDIFGEGKQQLLIDVKQDLEANLGPKGFVFDMVSFVGALRVDGNVARSINAVIEATQRAIEAENKVRQATAEANQMIETAKGDSASVMIRAVAQAEANRKLNESLSDRIVQWKALDKWDGVLPKVTAETVPFITID